MQEASFDRPRSPGMAHQAILAADRRRKKEAADAANLVPPVERAGVGQEAILKALKSQRWKLGKMFEMWDHDGNGSIDKSEFRSALLMLGLKPTPRDLQEFFDQFDQETHAEGVTLEDIFELLDQQEGDKDDAPKSLLLRLVYGFYDLINTMAVQTTLYLAVVVTFQLLTDTMRVKEEFYLDKHIADTFIDNPFNELITDNFLGIRRHSDIWLWGNTVLWPGLLGNGETVCNGGDVGAPGVFRSAEDGPATTWAGCNDHVWPDGLGEFNTVDGTAWTVGELSIRMSRYTHRMSRYIHLPLHPHIHLPLHPPLRYHFRSASS